MAWIRRRPLLSCFLLALALRAGLSVVTERAPLFPSYYYTDAELIDGLAWDAARSWEAGRWEPIPGSPSQRLHAYLLGRLYQAFGHHALLAKLLMSLAGALGVILLALLCAPQVGSAAALAGAAALALWPSHVFFTSQDFKDAVVILFCYAALAAGQRLLTEEGRPSALAGAVAVPSALCALGFWRSYVMLTTAGALAAGALVVSIQRWKTGPRKGPLLCLLGALAGPLAFQPLSRAVFEGTGRLRAVNAEDPTFAPETMIPNAYDGATQRHVQALSPEGISRIRLLRQRSDQIWASQYRERSIGTQLFHGLDLRSWWDVAVFLPKGAFYVLFMPLPFLYPLAGNLGRILASIENLALLGLAAAGVWGAGRGLLQPGRPALVLFFLAMVAGSALLEFDLGSAARHKQLFMPLLFPFAFSLILPRRRPLRPGRLRVLQVLECGGPGGTGNQVAALCNGLDAARFESVLVFAARGADPEAYRRLASGAARSHHVPELVREISPWSDLKALRRLISIFREELPDVVHLHSSKAGVLGRLAALFTGVPLVYYSPHGYGFLQADRSALSRFLYRAAEWSVSWIGEVVAVSPGEAELARPLAWGKTVHTVPDPYLGERPDRPSSRPGGLVIGACGRLTAARNPEAFLRLSAALFKARPEASAVWIGGGEGEPEFRRAVEKAGLRGRLAVTGWLEAGEVRERLNGLSVFVHYSRWDALPNAVLEAMAAGLPVVASDIRGNRDAVVHGETGFLAKDEDELLAFSLRLLADPALSRRLGEAGRERVRRVFSREAALARLAELYSVPPPTTN